jgi:ferredoxin
MLAITEDCINCNACIDECPNNAIFTEGETYTVDGATMPPLSDDHTFIAPELCKMCEGYSDTPSCISVCPTEAVLQC